MSNVMIGAVAKRISSKFEEGDKVKIAKEYGGGTGKVVDVVGSFVVVKTKNGNESYHSSDLKVISGIGALSLKQYIDQNSPNQNDKVKLLKSQVIIRKYDKYGLREVKIKKFPFYSYVQTKGNYALYTKDNSGNPGRQTNFLLDHK